MTKRYFKIISIDGGGIRGYVPLTLIQYIQSRTRRPIHDSFELFAGTSTGAIICSALTLSDTSSIISNRRKYTASRVKKIYSKRASEIFPIFKTKGHKKANWLFSYNKPEHDNSGLNNILLEFFQDQKISSCLKPIYIPTFDLINNKPLIFTSRAAHEFGPKNLKLKEILMAATAAPTYFESKELIYNNLPKNCIDGGVYLNNPTLGALLEVLEYKNHPIYNLDKYDEIKILSIGTGIYKKNISRKQSKKWGWYDWTRPIIDITMFGTSELIDNQIKTISKNCSIPISHDRYNISLSNKDLSGMDNSHPLAIDYLKEEIDSQWLQNTEELKRLDKFLKAMNLI